MSRSVLEGPTQDPSLRSRQSSTPDTEAVTKPIGLGWWRETVAWVGGIFPNIVVFGLLAGVGLMGHHTDWKLPKFSALMGTTSTDLDDWCDEHGVPESACVTCKPSLLPDNVDYGWCAKHGVHNCPFHHPDVAQLKDLPVVEQNDLDRAERALALIDRKVSNAACKMYQSKIQFASVAAVRQAGVDVDLVERQSIAEAVVGNGEIRYDPTQLASLSTRVPGIVWNVEKSLGDSVQKGEVLAIVDAIEVGQAKTRLMETLAELKLQQKNVTRLRTAGAAVAGRHLIDAEAAATKAEAAVLQAEQMLLNLGLPVAVDQLRNLTEREVLQELRYAGLPESIRAKIRKQTASANLVPVLAPMDGIVVDRKVTAGEVVSPSMPLFQVADTSQMWLILNIALEHADQLAIGQTVHFRPDGSQHEVSGKLSWISTAADRQTRMIKVRAELPNPKGKLRDETFGMGRVVLRTEADAIVVPSNAVHWEGCCQVVFVRDKHFFARTDSPKVFHVRTVRTGATTDKMTEIIAGVLPGEVVATSGSDVLRAQLLKNNLGAGCCGEE